ncbi:hypothetical protein K0M31_000591 [Melipona bicolor]|uniref:Uncharacterized protein n=1 Tax=Melipona bicolor TaxID=60889 RepID=A0AA40KSY9_9HYME|nr:hypothetical protein K0M31_017959 [Melipona bicolor]KAK1136022.1 hypothetical protein K0M31_000591 [Melipona bicolor]
MIRTEWRISRTAATRDATTRYSLQSGIKSTVISLRLARSCASVAGRLHVGTKLDKYHLDANDGTANVKPSLPVCRATSRIRHTYIENAGGNFDTWAPSAQQLPTRFWATINWATLVGSATRFSWSGLRKIRTPARDLLRQCAFATGLARPVCCQNDSLR